jgi:diacylglycerol kinase (ATP)
MSNPHKGRRGLNRLLHATRHSFDGLQVAYREESAFRQEFWLVVVMAPAAMWLGGNWLERALLLCCLAVVLIVELLNSGIEAAIDRVSFEHHELSKRAKDLASAAVMLSLLMCGGVWCAALWARLA